MTLVPFDGAINRAKAACRNLGQEDADHFAGSGKMVNLGSGAQRELADYSFSRLACYIITMHGDARKAEIAAITRIVPILLPISGYFCPQISS